MKFEIPRPLKAEHDALHTKLARAEKLPGRTGEAARAVASLLHRHFIREEEIALPALGLLKSLAEDKVTSDMAPVAALTERLKVALPEMLAEHRAIVGALEALVDAARTEDRHDVLDFAEGLILHAQMEEDVLYPAAILVGAYVREALDRWN